MSRGGEESGSRGRVMGGGCGRGRGWAAGGGVRGGAQWSGNVGDRGLGAGAADAAPAPVCSVETCTQTFTPTGRLQTFTVPAGVTSLAITAQGAAAPAFSNAGPVAGGVSSGTLLTQPGTSYGVLVGAVG